MRIVYRFHADAHTLKALNHYFGGVKDAKSSKEDVEKFIAELVEQEFADLRHQYDFDHRPEGEDDESDVPG